jgi:hypothetical protein
LQYSWDDWKSYGVANIDNLAESSLQIEDIHGSSSEADPNVLELVPTGADLIPR